MAVYRGVAERVGPILGFELGEMFAPFGKIYSLELFAELLQIPGLVGLKHSSLDRDQEWQRLELRDASGQSSRCTPATTSPSTW